MKSVVYNQEAEKAGEVDLPEKVFGLAWNNDLVHQVVTSTQTSRRANTAEAKDRGAVRGGGKKPWRQKGTGQARHGSIRSPLWRGGGSTHGPTIERNYYRKVNQKAKNKALGVVLSRKLAQGEVVFVDSLDWPEIKTKQASSFLSRFAGLPGLEKINYRVGRRALITLPKTSVKLQKSFRNLNSSLVTETRNLNPVDVLTYKYLVITGAKESLAILEQRLK